MHAVAAIPTLGVLIGSAIGLALPDLGFGPGFIGLLLAVLMSLWAWRTSRVALLAAGVSAGFAAGGCLLAIDAWRSAWQPPLRSAFENAARAGRRDAAAAGLVVSGEDGVLMTLTGVLRADASVRRDGSVSISVSVLTADAIGSRIAEAGSTGPGLRGSPPMGGVVLTVAGTAATERAGEWRAGRIVRVPARLRRPSRYLNPGAPDEERALARRGTMLVGVVKSGALVEVVARAGWLPETAGRARAFVRRAIASAVGRWNPRSAAIVTAIVIGDRAGLDDEVERRLQEAGTYHVIAISGGNIAVLVGLTLAGFRLAGALGRVAMLMAVACLIAYAYLVGGGASVSRATLMAVVYLAARAMDLRGPPANVLALAAGVLVAAQPLAILEPGFVLTFGATTAILVVVPLVPYRAVGPLAAPCVAMLLASVAAESALFPVSARLFSRVTFAGLAVNFAAIPLMAVAQVAGMAVVPAVWLSSGLALAIGWVAHLGAEGLVRSASLVDVAPFLTWRVAPPSPLVICTYYLGLVLGWVFWRRRLRTAGSMEGRVARAARLGGSAGAAVAALWMLGEPWIARSAGGDGRLHVTFIDVGQGDAALVRFPRGATLAVDAGGLGGRSSFDIGDRVVAPVLRRAGVRRLDSLAVTHGDFDHAGGAPAVLREFHPRDVWEGIPVPPFELLRALRAEARAAGMRWVNVQTGDRVEVDDVEVVVRHPQAADWERQDVRNDDSIVLELLWRDVSIVLAGDIGRDVEQAIAPLFAPSPLRVLKVPHHGSLTSSSREFVRLLAPGVAVVSVGRGNRFGHPAPDVIDRYRAVGAQIFRTDEDGAVTVDTDGYTLDVRTFTGQRVLVRPATPRRGEAE